MGFWKSGILTAAGLMFAMTAPASGQMLNRILADDFEAQKFAPEGGLYYKMNFEQSAGTVLFQSSDVRFGKGALSLSVKSLCPKTDSGCSERAEVWERKKLLLPYDAPVWYAFSMKLTTPIPSDNNRYLMAQWKRKILPGATTPFSPFLALRLNKGKIVFTIETNEVPVKPLTGKRANGCLEGETLVLNRPEEKQTRALVAWQPNMKPMDWRHKNACTTAIRIKKHAGDLPMADSGWNDFVISIHTGPQGDGKIGIFANDKPVVTITGHIGHDGDGLGANQYFKFGPYRAGKPDTWTVLYDRFRRGPTCKGVGTDRLCNLASTASK